MTAETEAPTMEEILASIKGAIETKSEVSSDDKQRAASIKPKESDVLELKNPINTTDKAKAPNLLNKIDEELKANINKTVKEQVHKVKTESTTGKVLAGQDVSNTDDAPQEVAASLLSEKSVKQTSEALRELKEKINSVPSVNSKELGSANVTVEELVKQILKPYLSAWLDKNLPGIVERAVKEEIQKIAAE